MWCGSGVDGGEIFGDDVVLLGGEGSSSTVEDSSSESEGESGDWRVSWLS